MSKREDQILKEFNNWILLAYGESVYRRLDISKGTHKFAYKAFKTGFNCGQVYEYENNMENPQKEEKEL